MKTKQEIRPGIYKHSKTGAEVRVYFTVKHSETLEEMVAYEHLNDYPMGKYWARPVFMWNEIVDVKGKKKVRFEWIREN